MPRVHLLREAVAEARAYQTDFSAGAGINSLPPDMLVRIMGHGSESTLMPMMLTCKLWKRCCVDQALWKSWSTRRWRAKMNWSLLLTDEVTDDFLEEYGWLRLYREVLQFERLETILMRDRSAVHDMTHDVTKRLDSATASLKVVEKSLAALSIKDCQALGSAERNDGNEAIVSATMILRRGDPSWLTMVEDTGAEGSGGGRAIIEKILHVDYSKFTPGMFHRVQRLSSSPQFSAAAEGNGVEALRLLAQWVLACQAYMDVQRQLAPAQEKLRTTQEALPAHETQYEAAKASLKDVLGDVMC